MSAYSGNNILLGAYDKVNRRVPLLHVPRGVDFWDHRDNLAFFTRNFRPRLDGLWVGIRNLKTSRHQLSCPSYNLTFMLLFFIP